MGNQCQIRLHKEAEHSLRPHLGLATSHRGTEGASAKLAQNRPDSRRTRLAADKELFKRPGQFHVLLEPDPFNEMSTAATGPSTVIYL